MWTRKPDFLGHQDIPVTGAGHSGISYGGHPGHDRYVLPVFKGIFPGVED